MAQKPRQPRTNRYKKQNGKGGLTALAVFIVLVLALMVGGYYFLSWQQQETLFKPQKTPVPSVSVFKALLPAPPVPVPEKAEPYKEAGPDWEHYTDDTPRPVPQAPQIPQRQADGRAELAIIVDDMGSSLQEVRSLTAIGVPITLAVIPGLRHDREVAALAAGQGAEVMLHLPMQSKEYPRRRLESNGLLLEYDHEKLQQLVAGYFEQVPQAKGANNHMGSAFTEEEVQMRTVLSLLRQRGLFFVDSVTTPASVGSRLAVELGVRHARRDVFLDNEQQEGYILNQLNTAVKRARKTGRAIAICHPHPVTIAALAKALPGLQQQGITLVHASRLVR